MKINVIFPNKKTISVNVANKCGSSTVLGTLGYPRLGEVVRHISPGLRQYGEYYENNEDIPFDPLYKFAIVRDPVDRMTSIYRQRVLQIGLDNIKDEVVDWDYFVINYKDIELRYPDIHKNGHKQIDAIGTDASLYNKIFNTKNLSSQFRLEISKISEVQIPIVHMKHTKQNIGSDIIINESHIEMIKTYFSEDYIHWGNYFQ